jgi:lipopolysaccharide transport system permease protein
VSTSAVNEIVIEPGRTEREYWIDLWRYRELFYFLAWRDILVRYKQTVVGVTWTVIRPLLTMAVLTLVFGRLAGMPSHGAPYSIMVFCGMLPWQFFSTALSECGNSLIVNASLISKVYFPRMTVPASSVVTSLVDFACASAVLVLLCFWYHFVPSGRIVLLPAFMVLMFAAAFGVGVWMAALTVSYRDVRVVVPFIVQFGLYISPVGFPSDVVPERWRLLYSLNPMVGVIDGFRWSILPDATIHWTGVLISTVVVVLMTWTGIRYFRRTEKTFADVI